MTQERVLELVDEYLNTLNAGRSHSPLRPDERRAFQRGGLTRGAGETAQIFTVPGLF